MDGAGLAVAAGGGLAVSGRLCESTQQTSRTSWHSLGLNRMSMTPKPPRSAGSHKWYGTHVHLAPASVVKIWGAVVG